jgi:membrane fusion protein, heavy metal efflux system
MCPVQLRERTVSIHHKHALPPELAPRKRRPKVIWVAMLGVVVTIAVTAAAFLGRGWWLSSSVAALDSHDDAAHACGESCDHDHGNSNAIKSLSPLPPHDQTAESAGEHDEHDEANALHLSEEARKNVGMRLVSVEPRDFDRTIGVPAMVIERPGRTRIKVSAPMTGVVTRIYPIRGEAVAPGQRLFELRLTHEDLVAAQSEYLRTVEELDVMRREVARIEKVTASGAIAGKTLLARQYELQKTSALLHSQQQALILHGLTEKQVADIAASRKLLQNVMIVAPEPPERAKSGPEALPMEIAELTAEQGQQVVAGEPLCVLTDHASLYVEGKAFAEDAGKLQEAAKLGSPITAMVQDDGKEARPVDGLKILYVENEVERESRALRFYAMLPNELVRNETMPDGHRFVGWRYKPGQRVELLVPVERWKDRVVLPVDAVVKDGVDCYVFEKKGECFERRPVHVEYRDQRFAVLGGEKSLAPGETIVASGAYQMHLALKNRKGGAEKDDKHVGCSH